ncbi:MAG: alpha/beta hydrolase [Desulfobacterales bacterium]|nr:alpha/beta hydrolase [Desulfobacterales bacterium]
MGCTSSNLKNSVAQRPALINNPHKPDMSIEIEGLCRCTGADDNVLNLNSEEPLTVLVHGCKGSAAKFRALAEVFAFHGQQTVCFSYNDRDSLMKSSSDLIQSLNRLFNHMPENRITLIGHSQGGMIARKALIKKRADELHINDRAAIRLVTVSSPFAGINAAKHCGSKMGRKLTLGLLVPICKLISGGKWFEITSASEFIQKPGTLIDPVSSYLKIDTDERNSCRKYSPDGSCLKEDFVFSTEEQYHSLIDEDKMTDSYEIVAGHAEIVGDEQIKPQKLISIFQVKGIMPQTPPERKEELALLLNQLF